MHFCKKAEERAAAKRVAGNQQGISHQNYVALGMMAQYEDNPEQVHNMRLMTLMKRLESTQEMVEMKMMMWEKMVDSVSKNQLFMWINSLMDLVERLN